ncbi:MAG: hypothetical protein HQ498_09260 [Pseudohongiella sp.]|nr:hypothetical protein [Pseudohongiella sp.]
MITLLTGVPGTGKTCYMMDFLIAAQKEGRPLYVHGIPDLTIPHTPVLCSAASCKVCASIRPGNFETLLAEDWDSWAPDGALLCFDEVQNIYRPRKQGAEIPTSVMAFETHRHSGLDFYLITQSPMLFDSNVRRLVGRHIHLKSTWAGRNQYEWGECQDNIKSLSGAVKSSYTLNKKNFGLFKSAEIHTKQKKKMPFAVYALVGLLIMAAYLSVRVKNSLSNRGIIGTPAADAQAADVGVPINLESASSVVTPGLYDYKPLVLNHPESALAFTELVEIVSYPRVAACIVTVKSGDCRCYSQQATPIEVEYSFCRNFLLARPFNPYKPEPMDKEARADNTL